MIRRVIIVIIEIIFTIQREYVITIIAVYITHSKTSMTNFVLLYVIDFFQQQVKYFVNALEKNYENYIDVEKAERQIISN